VLSGSSLPSVIVVNHDVMLQSGMCAAMLAGSVLRP
jgi:hypothetical protein